MTKKAFGHPPFCSSERSEYTVPWAGHLDEILAQLRSRHRRAGPLFRSRLPVHPFGPVRKARYEPPESVSKYSRKAEDVPAVALMEGFSGAQVVVLGMPFFHSAINSSQLSRLEPELPRYMSDERTRADVSDAPW
jgi:hypothetical protein